MKRTGVIVLLAMYLAIFSGPPLVAQRGAGTGAGSRYTVPRTSWGDPDLQGIWPSTHMVGVPLQRDPKLGTRNVLTDDEFAQRQKQSAQQADAVLEEFSLEGADGGDGTGPPPHWLERGTPQRQASLIVSPADGRLPPMTEYGQQRAAERARRSSTGAGPFNSPEDLDYYDRCIARGVLGSITPVIYNNGTQIVQAPGYVAIRYEMIHETRIIPLDTRPAPRASSVSTWASRAGGGRARRSWSKRRTSRARLASPATGG